jgi:hypothetical protein
VPLVATAGFMHVLDAIRLAPEPRPIAAAYVTESGEDPRRVVSGVDQAVLRAAESLQTFEEQAVPWTAARDQALMVGGTEVARWVHQPELEPFVSPKPYLHPVRTLKGTHVTDAAPGDHRWHLGVFVALADVTAAGESTNFWGGRTYRAADGYQPRDDHGTILQAQSVSEWDSIEADLEWRDRHDRLVLRERRALSVTAIRDAWVLDLRFELRNPGPEPVSLGSPGTHGRPNAGYGGFFWRLPASAAPIEVWTASESGEAGVHGKPAPWLALTADSGAPSCGYTLVFLPGDAGAAADPWFVRVADYPGVGSALAYTRPVELAPGAALSRSFRVLVADDRRTHEEVAALVAALGAERGSRA